MKRRILNCSILSIMIIIIMSVSIEEYEENQIEEKTSNESNTTVVIIEEEHKKEYPKEEIIEEYKGYDVMAKLEIPIINLETYILKNYSEKALNVSVTKFWGVNANEKGNFCVAGHNFKRKNMFRNLKKLEKGDVFTISDNTTGKVQYKIYDIYIVVPEDIRCLEQNAKDREVTLITCTNDSKKRIIVKAKEL